MDKIRVQHIYLVSLIFFKINLDQIKLLEDVIILFKIKLIEII